MRNDKNCSVCVYDSVCETRKRDASIKDCCVPELPLRLAQTRALRAGGVARFIIATREHVASVKGRSQYWSGK